MDAKIFSNGMISLSNLQGRNKSVETCSGGDGGQEESYRRTNEWTQRQNHHYDYSSSTSTSNEIESWLSHMNIKSSNGGFLAGSSESDPTDTGKALAVTIASGSESVSLPNNEETLRSISALQLEKQCISMSRPSSPQGLGRSQTVPSRFHHCYGQLDENNLNLGRSKIDAPDTRPSSLVGEEDQDVKAIPRLNIAMLSVGTRGDVQPFVAIAKHLQEYGHRVLLATYANFCSFVTSSGIEFYPLGGDPSTLAEYMVRNKGFLPSGPSEISFQRKLFKAIVNSLLSAYTEPDIDSGVPFRA